MSGRSVAAKVVLQLVVFLAASGLAGAFGLRPSWSASFVLTVLVAAYRPIWKDGRAVNRIIQFALGALVGLTVWAFVGWTAEILFRSGIFDAGGAANVAGFKGVLGSLAAYAATLVNGGLIVDFVTLKGRQNRPTPTSFVWAAALAPSAGIIAAVFIWEVFSLRHNTNPLVVIFVVGGASFPFLARVVHWILSYQIFGLQGATVEGSRRLGLLAGWILGVPIGVLVLPVFSDLLPDDLILFFAPVAGFGGFLLVYISVHAIFWTLDGFRSKSD